MFTPNLEVFVDGGGNSAVGVERYLAKFPPFHKVFVFEPNPAFNKSYTDKKITLIQKAIWTEDGTFPFYLSKDEKQASSSLLSDKLCRVGKEFIQGFQDDPIQVECVDFSQWLKSNIKPHYSLTLKLDIEGAEYKVLRKMIDDGTINLVKNLYVEFHRDHLKMSIEEHNLLLSDLRGQGIEPKEWD